MNRWRWLLRPRWFLSSGLAIAMLVWVFWPIPIYRPGVGTFLMVEQRNGKSQFLGTVEIGWHASPSQAKIGLAELKNVATATRATEDGHWWVSDGAGSDRLCFTRGNLLVKINPAKPDQDPPPIAEKWPSQFEKVARETDASILAGSVGGREVVVNWSPRGVNWLFPEGLGRAGIARRWDEFRKLFGL